MKCSLLNRFVLLSSFLALSVSSAIANGHNHYVNCEDTGTGIQDAVNMAHNGDTIVVTGKAVQIVGKKLTLKGMKGAKIEAPDAPWNFEPYTSRHPIILAVNGYVMIKNFIIDGRIKGDSRDFASLMGGYFLNASGSLTDSRITRVRRETRISDWEIAPVRILNTSIGPAELEVRSRRVRIYNNKIDDFESNGIFANTNDDMNNLAPLKFDISYNRITGAGSIYESQNGIQILGFGSGL